MTYDKTLNLMGVNLNFLQGVHEFSARCAKLQSVHDKMKSL